MSGLVHGLQTDLEVSQQGGPLCALHVMHQSVKHGEHCSIIEQTLTESDWHSGLKIILTS